jgi:hypothetical protein
MFEGFHSCIAVLVFKMPFFAGDEIKLSSPEADLSRATWGSSKTSFGDRRGATWLTGALSETTFKMVAPLQFITGHLQLRP